MSKHTIAIDKTKVELTSFAVEGGESFEALIVSRNSSGGRLPKIVVLPEAVGLLECADSNF